MSDPLSICASVIAIATVVYASCKALHELIEGTRNAPQAIINLKSDIKNLQNIIDSLKSKLDVSGHPRQFSDNQLAVLRDVLPPLQSCSDLCESFKARLEELLSNSGNGRSSLRDAVKIHFNEKEISAFRFQLGSYRSTLSIALSFAIMQTTTENHTATKELVKELEDTRQLLSGQIQGLTMGLPFLAASGDQIRETVQRTELQISTLAQCLAICMTTWEACSKATGTTTKYVEALDDSRLLLGNIGNIGNGGPAVTIDVLITKNRARMMAGNVEGSVALQFMNLPVTHVSRSSDRE